MPHSFPAIVTASTCLYLILGMSRVTSANPTPELLKTTLQAMTARAESLYSARITFTVTDHTKEPQQKQLTLSFSGHQWALRYDQSNNVMMNRENALLRYYESFSETGQSWHALHLTAPQSQTTLLGSDYAFAVGRLGTLWYPSQIRFITQTQAELLPTDHLHGYRTTVLRWPVNLQNIGKAFVVVPGAVENTFEGYLQIYAAPDLGHALMRIDYLDDTGRLLRRYESRDFQEIDDNLYFPFAARCSTFHRSQSQIFEFHVEKVEFANQQIPAKDFDIQVPVETRIRDSRPGFTHAAFRLGAQADLKEINRRLRHIESSYPSWPKRRVVCLVINGLLVLYLSTIWIRKRWAGKY